MDHHDRQEWLAVRQYLRANRIPLTVAAVDRYPDHERVAGTTLLADPGFVPPEPIELDRISLVLNDTAPAPAVVGNEPEGAGALPADDEGRRFDGYYDAVAALDPPKLFENRPLYRLCGARLTGPAPTLSFADGTYFEAAGLGDACGHEFAAAHRRGGAPTPLRDLIGDPCDPSRRSMPMAVSALTIRFDRRTGAASFPLHWRDPALVAHAGGMHHTLPAGTFQAAGPGPVNRAADFGLWRCMVREYAEELAGQPEMEADTRTGIDYDNWPFAKAMAAARADGKISAHALALGVDPLTLAVDLLAAFVFDAEVYDSLFATGSSHNEEGRILLGTNATGYTFDSDTIGSLLASAPLQPGGAALLRLADRHRGLLLESR